MSSPATWVPDACTLPTAEQPLRVAEFDDLFQTALQHLALRDPRRLVLHFEGYAGLAHRVQDLVDRESACCAFFGFRVQQDLTGGVRLDVTVPSGHEEVLEALTLRAAARAGLVV